MRAKYYKKSNPVVKTLQYGDSHVWRRMVEISKKVENAIE